MSGIKFTYDTLKADLSFQDQESVLEVLIKSKVPVDHSCEGMASCGTCRILVTSGVEDLPPRNSLEQEMATDRGFEPHERLACQLCPLKPFSFKLPSDG